MKISELIVDINEQIAENSDVAVKMGEVIQKDLSALNLEDISGVTAVGEDAILGAAADGATPMKASELVTALTTVKNASGDLEVFRANRGDVDHAIFVDTNKFEAQVIPADLIGVDFILLN